MKNIKLYEDFLNEINMDMLNRMPPNNYIQMTKNKTLKDLDGKEVNLERGDRGTHKGTDMGPDFFIIKGHVFDADEFDNGEYDVS